MNTLLTKKIVLDDLPADLKNHVRMPLVKKHMLGMSIFGSRQIGRMERDKLNLTENILVSYYAFEAAIKREDYAMLPELAGYSLYGFVEADAVDAANNFVAKLVNPEEGGSLNIDVTLWMNLRHLKNIYSKSINPVEVARLPQVEALIAQIVKGFEDQLEGLWGMDKLYALRILDLQRELKMKIYIGLTAIVAIIITLTRILPLIH